MSLLLQISDPHFGTEQPAVVEALSRLVQRERPSLVVVSGDITQRATAAQFATARRFVDALRVPRVLVIPGNHDIPLFNPVLRFLHPYRRHREAFGHDLEPSYESHEWLVVALNTTRRWRHQNGELSAEQIERVSARLRVAAETQLRVVVVHQPVAVPRVAESRNLLRRHERAVREWSNAGVDIILAGHIHLPYVLPLHDRIAGLTQPAWAVNAGTAVSDRVRHDAGNSVNLIRAQATRDGPRGCIVERWDFVDATRGFEAAARHRLACGATRSDPSGRGRRTDASIEPAVAATASADGLD